MKSYFNPNQKRKKERERLESLWGSELGISLQKFSISDTKYIQQSVSQKRPRETPGGPGELIPPLLILRSAARFPGRVVQRSGSDHSDVWDYYDDNSSISGRNFRELLGCPGARTLTS